MKKMTEHIYIFHYTLALILSFSRLRIIMALIVTPYITVRVNIILLHLKVQLHSGIPSGPRAINGLHKLYSIHRIAHSELTND